MWLQKLGHCEQSEPTIELIIEFGLRVPENRISVGGPTVCNCHKGDWTAPGVKTINCLSKKLWVPTSVQAKYCHKILVK